jgi:cytochrome c oxidase subunit 1
MGLVSEVIHQFAQTDFGYMAMTARDYRAGLPGMAHHMFVTGLNFPRIRIRTLTLLIAVPSAIKVFNWSPRSGKEISG